MDSIVTGGGVLWLCSDKLVLLCELDSAEMSVNELSSCQYCRMYFDGNETGDVRSPSDHSLDGSIDAEIYMR